MIIENFEIIDSNYWSIINYIRGVGITNKSKIPESIGIASSTIYRTASELEINNILIKADNQITLNSKIAYFLGVSIGHHKITYSLVDFDFRVVDSYKIAVNTNLGFQGLINALDELFIIFFKKLNIDINKIKGIGFSFCGAIDHIQSEIKYASFYGISNIPFTEILACLSSSDKLKDIPFIIDHDVKCTTIAEKEVGNDIFRTRPEKDICVITSDKGLACGFILNNSLFRGRNNFSGELGHIILDDKSNISCSCGCGRNGTLENIIRNALNSSDSSFDNIHQPDKVDFEQIGYYLGKSLSFLVNLFNPELIVITGSLLKSFSKYYPNMRKTLNNNIWTFSRDNVRIEQSKIDDPTSIGAAIDIYYKLTGNNNFY